LEVYVNDFTIPKALASAKAFASLMGWTPLMGQAFLVNRSSKVMLFTIYPDENPINKRRITISLMFFLESGSIFWAKFNTPQSDRFVTDVYPALS
jgi:hypothetical protein